MRTIALLTVALAFSGSASAASWPTGQKLKAIVTKSDPCLAQIIERETGGTWDPTISYGFKHNPRDSYGLGQANPGRKMAPFGKDWLTNPWTQLKWARAYAKGRYGSTCRAWEFWQRHHYW